MAATAMIALAAHWPRIAATTCLVLCCHAFAPPTATADRLDDIRRRGELIWGADQEGGGPYVFPDAENPDVLRGFEVELAGMLAQELGVRPRFQQGQWDGLGLLVDRGDIDVVLNGYELTPTRERDYRCTRPYYLYGLQLMTRWDSPIRSWADLRDGDKRWRVGALIGSAAETHLRSEYGDAIEVVTYDGNTDAMLHTSQGALDATLQDDCIAIFYADRFPELKFIERPVAPGAYIAMVARDQPRLQEALNEALERIVADGRIEQLYDRWDLSGRVQALALKSGPRTPDAAKDFTDMTSGSANTGQSRPSSVSVIRNNLGLLLRAAGVTILLSVTAMPLAIVIGMLVAVGRLYGPWPVAKLLGLYVEVLRGTPLMLQLFVIFFLLPEIGILVNPLFAAISGLALNYSAYEAEIYRAGLQAVPRGQMEAGLALGMSKGQSIRRIVLPQAFRLVIPPVTNDFIALFKDTSVCSVVTVVELTKRYNVLAQSTGAILELATVTALLYLLMSYPLSLFARWSERRLDGGRRD